MNFELLLDKYRKEIINHIVSNNITSDSNNDYWLNKSNKTRDELIKRYNTLAKLLLEEGLVKMKKVNVILEELDKKHAEATKTGG